MTSRRNPLDPSPGGEPPDALIVQVDGAGAEPTRLFTISRPQGDVVRVREWSSGGGGDAAVTEREARADELYAMFERAVRQRRRVSEDLYRIRHWLAGTRLD